ncbi:glutamine-synthetase adenylyltransferase [Anopheles sinensis]|uniref:Glutamine-synthetase adenylyltransferase n=1 Tax=Anopheles sinensis TaxID=74873 RepID=A0A084WAQ7_ANOSI|nr:glutamine-synthetase adenylyltransferase [Anopheles sinensis]
MSPDDLPLGAEVRRACVVWQGRPVDVCLWHGIAVAMTLISSSHRQVSEDTAHLGFRFRWVTDFPPFVLLPFTDEGI